MLDPRVSHYLSVCLSITKHTRPGHFYSKQWNHLLAKCSQPQSDLQGGPDHFDQRFRSQIRSICGHVSPTQIAIAYLPPTQAASHKDDNRSLARRNSNNNERLNKQATNSIASSLAFPVTHLARAAHRLELLAGQQSTGAPEPAHCLFLRADDSMAMIDLMKVGWKLSSLISDISFGKVFRS